MTKPSKMVWAWSSETTLQTPHMHEHQHASPPHMLSSTVRPHPLTRQTNAPIMGGTLEVSRQHRLRRKRRNSAACVVTLAKLQHVHLVLHTQNGYVS